MVEERTKELAQGANFATITTLAPSGWPQTNVMWVDADDDHILFNTEVHRDKFRNIEADARVTVAIWDQNNPYSYVQVRGRVAEKVTGPAARAHIDQLSEKYTGGPYNEAMISSERVILKILPEQAG